MDTIINTVLDEIISIHESLKTGHALRAYALYLDFCGDIQKLNTRDNGAACALLWYGIQEAGFELYSDGGLREYAGFQLAW